MKTKKLRLRPWAIAAALLLLLAACGKTGPKEPTAGEGRITGYVEVDGTPAIELGKGHVVLLDKLDDWEALHDRFAPDAEPKDGLDSARSSSLDPQQLPARVDLRANQTPIKDQGGRGTCVAFATTAAIEAAYKRERGLTLDLSEQYNNHIQKMTVIPAVHLTILERENLLGAWGSGNVIYQLSTLFAGSYGLPLESELPYQSSGNYEVTSQAGDVPYIDKDDPGIDERVDFWNLSHEATTYQIPGTRTLTNLPRAAVEGAVYGSEKVRAVTRTLNGLKAELSAGREVAFTVGLTKPRAGTTEQAFVDGIWVPLTEEWGAHAMLMVGYDDARQAFIVKNSWGKSSSGRAAPAGADADRDGFIEFSYAWVPRIYEAFSVLETRDPVVWGRQNQQVLLGRWRTEFDNHLGRADLASYHVPGAFPDYALAGQRDHHIGTLYTATTTPFRVNGLFTVDPNRRELDAFFGTTAINTSFDATAGGAYIEAYVFTQDANTMAGWFTDTSGETTPYYASLDGYPAMTPARASASSVTPEDYLGRWAFSDDGVEGVLDLKTIDPGGASVSGVLHSLGTDVEGVQLTPTDSDPCGFVMDIPFAAGAESYGGGLYCHTDEASKNALMAGTSQRGIQTRGFYAYRTGDVPIEVEITSPEDGASFPRGTRRVDFEAGATNFDALTWTSSIDGEIGTGTSFSRLDLSFGTHEITANASNADGGNASDSVSITITNDPPTVTILEPVSTPEPFCVGEPVTFRASATDVNNWPDHDLPDEAVSWHIDGGAEMGTGKTITYTFTEAGGYNVVVVATDDQGLEGGASINVAVVECPDSPPSVAITAPPTDSGVSDAEYVYDGRDDGLGLWYTDVSFKGVATDPEDGALTAGSLVWTTDRGDLQDTDLGTGTSLTVRLYSDTCTGVWHTVSLAATDSDGNTRIAVRRIHIWTLC